MTFFKKAMLVAKVKKFMEDGDKKIRDLSIEEPEKLLVLETALRRQRSFDYWGSIDVGCSYYEEKFAKDIDIVINNLSYGQIFSLKDCLFDFILYLATEKNKEEIEEIIDRIVKPFNGSYMFFKKIFCKKYTIDQIEFILKNDMRYSNSDYHDEFDYDKIYDKLKQLKLDPCKEYANKIDISMIERFCSYYSDFTLCQKEELLIKTEQSFKEFNDIKTFFKLICPAEKRHDFSYEEIKVIISRCKEITELYVLFENCKKEEVFAKILNFNK